MALTRKDFIRLLVFGLGGTAAGCGGSDGGGGGGAGSADCLVEGATAASISANHGHRLDVPAAAFTTSGGGTYSILGTADHDHTITLTGPQLQTIAGGTAVSATSSPATVGLDHTHGVVVICG